VSRAFPSEHIETAERTAGVRPLRRWLMRRECRFARIAGAVGLVGALALTVSCGGDGGPTTPVTTTPTTTLPPPPSVVLETGGPIGAGYVWAWPFTTSRAGTIDATVNYTYSTNALVVWVARGSCTSEQFVADQCVYAATSFAGPNPRKVSVTGAAAGDFIILIGNAGPEDDSVSFQVVLTPTAASAGGAAATLRAQPGYPVSLPPR
jgi:hypothetical protein